MQKRNRPAVDQSISPLQGVTRDGQPLSYNRAPSPDLAPWIARLYVTKVDAPADHQLNCSLFNDVACVRIQLAGEWTAETADGPRSMSRAALFFGPHTRRLPVSVTGPFISVGVQIRPGASTALRGPPVASHVDRLTPISELTGKKAKVLDLLEPDMSPQEWVQVLENLFRGTVERNNGALPDPISQRFEWMSFLDPTISVADFARECDVDKRKLERIIRRDFGLSPKQVLRRARALDMASQLRGVADNEEAAELALRYYDQSHLIREFVELFGMSPTQFVSTPQPILTLALESRQSRRLEALERLKPGALRPWE